MAWVVDTCLLIDVLEDDPEFGGTSAALLEDRSAQGLLICPVTYVELAPAFLGDVSLQEEFLTGVGVDWRQGWTWQDSVQAHSAWHLLIQKKRAGSLPKRPLADLLIGAFAARHDGLLTRNGKDFNSLFPELRVPEYRVPGSSLSS